MTDHKSIVHLYEHNGLRASATHALRTGPAAIFALALAAALAAPLATSTYAIGQVYSLSLDVNPTTAPDPTTWFALGFVPAISPPGNFFGGYNAGPWMILRTQRDGFDNIPDNSNDVGDIQTFPGPLVTGFQDHDAPHGVVAFEIRLDTTGAQWQTKWFVNNALIRSETYATNPTINYVGFGRLLDTQGYVDNFALTVLPEPTTLALFAIVLALSSAIRRRR
jgi:hypothetical protein